MYKFDPNFISITWLIRKPGLSHGISLMKFLLIFMAVFSSFEVFSQSADLNKFRDFVIKNYRLRDSLEKDCDFNYAAILISSDLHGKITKINFLNDAREDLRKSFLYLKGFKFSPSMKVNRRPVLLICTVDQRNKDLCPVLYPNEESPSKLVREITDLISTQLHKTPQTIICEVFNAASSE